MNARRESILREMGLGPIWRLRGPASPLAVEPPLPVASPNTAVAEPERGASDPGTRQPMVERNSDHLETSPTFSRSVVQQSDTLPTVQPSADRRRAHIASLDWDALESDILGCSACRLCESRQRAVPGIGDRRAAWMLVGEGPGAEEDRRGEPFVGAAGQLLDEMLAAIGLTRSQGVYIANAVKCRPPLNRTPQPDEITACLPYLERQIELLKPKLLVALGRPAALSLLGQEIKINASRGRLFSHADIPVVITYHPAYLLRNQTDKGRAWEDLCFARATMSRLAGGDKD